MADPNDASYDYFNYICGGPSPSVRELPSSTVIINNLSIQGIVPDQSNGAVLGDLPCSMDSFINPEDPSLWNGLFENIEGGNGVPVDPGIIGPSSYNDGNFAHQPSSGETSNAAMAGTSGAGDFSELLGMVMGKVQPVWPPDPVPFYCSCCTVLRELIHSNGMCTTKLEIHGRIGIVSHAVLEIRDNGKSFHAVPEYQMFDFCKKSIMDVEQFLREYCNNRLSAGFTMLSDPLSLFFRSLCVGFEWNSPDSFNQNFSNPVPVTTLAGQETANKSKGKYKGKGKARIECIENGESSKKGGKKQTKTSLSKQRERTKSMTLKNFEAYFHIPIRIASEQVDLCPTVVKKICRECGLPRWPYRKIEMHLKTIRKSEELLLNSSSPEEKANAEAEMKMAQDLIAQIYAMTDRPRILSKDSTKSKK